MAVISVLIAIKANIATTKHIIIAMAPIRNITRAASKLDRKPCPCRVFLMVYNIGITAIIPEYTA